MAVVFWRSARILMQAGLRAGRCDGLLASGSPVNGTEFVGYITRAAANSVGFCRCRFSSISPGFCFLLLLFFGNAPAGAGAGELHFLALKIERQLVPMAVGSRRRRSFAAGEARAGEGRLRESFKSHWRRRQPSRSSSVSSRQHNQGLSFCIAPIMPCQHSNERTATSQLHALTIMLSCS